MTKLEDDIAKMYDMVHNEPDIPKWLKLELLVAVSNLHTDLVRATLTPNTDPKQADSTDVMLGGLSDE